MKTKPNKRFVVGYAGLVQDAVYTSGDTWDGGMQKMTYTQALKKARSMPSKKAKVHIFELVPVLTGKPDTL